MSQVTQKLITAEEFMHMPQPPDGSRQELVRGVIVTLPPPKARYGACCVNVVCRVGTFVKEKKLGTVLCNDAGFVSERDPDTVRGPDISFWSRERLPEIPDGYVEVAPDLAVEVVSPGDHYSRIQSKVHHHLTHGVRLLWVADPEDRSITVYRPGQQMVLLGENDTLSDDDVLPGFSCRVGELFG